MADTVEELIDAILIAPTYCLNTASGLESPWTQTYSMKSTPHRLHSFHEFDVTGEFPFVAFNLQHSVAPFQSKECCVNVVLELKRHLR